MAGIDKTISLRVIAQVKDYQKSIAGLEGDTKKAAMAAGRALSRELIKEQVKAANEGKKAAKQSANAWKKVGGAIAAALTIRGIQTGITQILSMAQATADLRNELTDTAVKSGLATDTLNGLRLAARGSGLEFGQLVEGLQQLPKRMEDVQRGTGEGMIAFQRLGVSVEDASGELRSADDVFKELVRQIQAIENPTERAALAAKALGETLGPRLIQSLGTAELQGFIDEAERLGLDVGPEAAAAAAEWQRQMAQLSIATEKATGKIGSAVIESGLLLKVVRSLVGATPILTSVINDAGARMKALAEASEQMSTLNPFEQWEGVKNIAGAMLPGIESTKRLADGIDESKRALEEFDEAAEDAGEAVDQAFEIMGPFVDMLALEAHRRRTAAAAAREHAKAVREAAAATAAQAKALNELVQIGFKAGDDLLSAEEKILIARDEQLAKIEELRIASGDSAHAAVASEEVKQRAIRDTTKVREAALAAAMEALGEAADAVTAQAERSADEVGRILAKFQDDQKRAADLVANQLINIMGSALSLVGDIAAQETARQLALFQKQTAAAQTAADEIEAIDSELAERRGDVAKELTNKQLRQRRRLLRGEERAAKEQAKKEKRATLEAFAREQSIAKTQVKIAAAILAIRLEAALAGALGPASIPVAVALAGAQLGIQLAAINKQQPPSFHQGGLTGGGGARPTIDGGPDAQSVTARPGEAGLTPLGVFNAGGEEGVNALNRGGRMSEERVTNIFVNDRLADRMVDRGLSVGGRAANRVRHEIRAGDLPGMVRVY